MKILKLASIFIVLVGGLLLAMYWGSIFDSTSKDDDDWSDEDLVDIPAKCDEIRKAWAAEKGWNATLYKDERGDIDQSKSMGMFSREGFNTVNNALRESATNKACEGYLAALHNSNFIEDNLIVQWNGVSLLKENEQLEGDPRVKNIENIHRLYKNIKAFVGSSHTITPHFDTDKADWVSFASAKSGILATAKSYRENPLFKEMAGVPGFKEGLDETKLNDVINPQRKNFYNRLSAQIISYFRSETPSEDKINLLNQIYKNFTYQESDYGVDSLAMLKVTYGK